MGRGRSAAAGGAALTLLLCAWVAAAGPVAIFRAPDANAFSTARAPRLGLRAVEQRPPPPKKIYTSTDANEAVVAVIVWGLKLAIVGIVATVLFLIAREFLRRGPAPPLRRAGRPHRHAARGPARGGERPARGLQTGTPSNAIVACWVRLEAEVAAAGFRHDSSRTSTEIVATVLREYDVDETALRDLAGLFREARFSAHELTEAHRARAADALTVLHVDLRRAAAKEALRA